MNELKIMHNNKPMSKKDAAKLLLEQEKQLYEFDFNNIKTPVTAAVIQQ